MTRRAVLCVLFSSFVAAGCRQPEGEIPVPAGEHANKAEDIRKDLQNVARRDPAAAEDLRNDLANLTAGPPEHLTNELAARLKAALEGTVLSDDAAKRLAAELYLTLASRDLSARQIAGLRERVKGTLTGLGVAPDKAEPVAEVVGDIQAAITTNRKRWWHRG